MLHRTTLAFLAASALAACDPSTPPSTADAAPDVAPDVAADAAPDVAADAAPDAARDAAADAPSLDVARDATVPPDLGRDVPPPDAACAGSAPSCVMGTAGGQCSDALTVARCEGGAWRCGAGEVLASECACIGRPLPGCTCARTGWVCPDAGTDASACPGSAPSCVMGRAGGQCSDVLTVARCEGGAWRCGAGEVLTSQCACIGLSPPGCTCTPSGLVCGDAGAPDVPATCEGRPAGCVSGTPGGTCGDVVTAPACVRGAWTCPDGQIPVTQCACVGRPPGSGCTCTASGWSCGDAGAADAAADGGTAGTLCGRDTDCASGLLCCYPCGIPGCMNRCMAPMGGRCPLIP